MLKRNAQGLSLVEVVVAISVTGILLTALSAPMAVAVMSRRNAQSLSLATQTAQSQIEAIRRSWQDPEPVVGADVLISRGQQNYDKNTISVVWRAPNTSAPCVPSAETTIDNVYETDNRDLTYNDVTNRLLSDVSQVAPNNTAIPASVRSIPIDVNNDCIQDYWGQIVFGNAPNNVGNDKLKQIKRVVVRIYRRQTNPSNLNYTPVNAGRPLLYSQSRNDQDGVSTWNLPLAVLITDIPRS